ncbi:MAG: carboxymuconolactone decarboxylase family protein [Clostridia bacterium]|nr:MAG: carboxymuconolactone decarboxylase family protein [Clostridia bacterium]
MPPFIQEIAKRDPELHAIVSQLYEKALSPGALDARTKTLIALDASHGAAEGVATLASRARSMGVSDAEIAEALRLAYFVAGNSTLKTSEAAFRQE